MTNIIQYLDILALINSLIFVLAVLLIYTCAQLYLTRKQYDLSNPFEDMSLKVSGEDRGQ